MPLCCGEALVRHTRRQLLENDASGYPDSSRSSRNVSQNHSVGTQLSVIADSDAPENSGAGTDEDAVANSRKDRFTSHADRDASLDCDTSSNCLRLNDYPNGMGDIQPWTNPDGRLDVDAMQGEVDAG